MASSRSPASTCRGRGMLERGGEGNDMLIYVHGGDFAMNFYAHIFIFSGSPNSKILVYSHFGEYYCD